MGIICCNPSEKNQTPSELIVLQDQATKNDALTKKHKYILVRHGESEGNKVFMPIVASLKQQKITREEFYAECLAYSNNEDVWDCKLTEVGLQQTVDSQASIKNIKLFKKVLVSPQQRTVQTAIGLLKNHPQKDDVKLIMVPRLKELLGPIDCTPKPVAELEKTLKESGFQYDMSLFDEFTDKDTWGLSVMTDEVIRKELVDNYEAFGKNIVKAQVKWNKDYKRVCEHDQLLFDRAQIFKEFLVSTCQEAQDDEHVLVVSHGAFLQALTCEGVKKVPQGGRPTSLGSGLINPHPAVTTNCKPTIVTYDSQTGKWEDVL